MQAYMMSQRLSLLVKNLLLNHGVEIHTQSRVKDVKADNNKIQAVITDSNEILREMFL